MGITGIYINFYDENSDVINLETFNSMNKYTNAYYIIDDMNFFLELVDDVEKTFVNIIVNVYNSQEDRNNRNNLLYSYFYNKEITKNDNILWTTQYNDFKQYLINTYETLLKKILYLDSTTDLPTEYQNLISFTDT